MINRNLTLFQLSPTDYGVEGMQWTEQRPSAPVTEIWSCWICSLWSWQNYIDLQNTRLNIKAKIVKPDGSNLPNLKKDLNTPITSGKSENLVFSNITSFITHGPVFIILICCDEMFGVKHNMLTKCDQLMKIRSYCGTWFYWPNPSLAYHILASWYRVGFQ